MTKELDRAYDKWSIGSLILTEFPNLPEDADYQLKAVWKEITLICRDIDFCAKIGVTPEQLLEEVFQVVEARAGFDLAILAEDYSSSSLSREQLCALERALGDALQTIRSKARRATLLQALRFCRQRWLSFATACVILVVVVYFALSYYWSSFSTSEWRGRSHQGMYILSSSQDWGVLRIDRDVNEQPLKINEVTYKTGLGTHSNSLIELRIPKQGRSLSGYCGVSDFAAPAGSIVCRITSDGVELFNSGILRYGMAAVPFKIPVQGRSRIQLMVEDAGDGRNSDHANWAEIIVTH